MNKLRTLIYFHAKQILPMTDPEIMFEIGGEGGSIEIRRRFENGKASFLYIHSETDMGDEGLDVNKEMAYSSFEEPFHYLTNRYRWYYLYLLTIHEEYQDFIAKKLAEKIAEGVMDYDELSMSSDLYTIMIEKIKSF